MIKAFIFKYRFLIIKVLVIISMLGIIYYLFQAKSKLEKEVDHYINYSNELIEQLELSEASCEIDKATITELCESNLEYLKESLIKQDLIFRDYLNRESSENDTEIINSDLDGLDVIIDGMYEVYRKASLKDAPRGIN